MSLRTAEQFKHGLRDGRRVYFRGQQVDDVTTHPEISRSVNHVALDFELAERAEFRELMTYVDPSGGRSSRYFKIPQNTDDLLKRREMIERSTEAASGLVLLIKEIGTDALFALGMMASAMDRKLSTAYLDRVRKFHEDCRQGDRSMAVAQTDAKGDRSKYPFQQSDPDLYVHLVEERNDGIVVSGAKVHTSFAPCVDEILVIPCRAMSEHDAAFAVAFAVKANAPGLTLIASPYGAAGVTRYQAPITSEHRAIETLTVFERVFVPWDRVFMKGEWQFAGALANTFVQFHRFTAIAYKPPLLDLLIGVSTLIAESNGIREASHVRHKLTELISYTETIRALSKAAALDCHIYGHGAVAVPNTIITNIAKKYFADHYHHMMKTAQDIAGGLVVTAPSEEDWANPETRKLMEKYLAGAEGIPTEDRIKLFNLIHELTASEFSGYGEVLAIHAEGSLEAQRLTILREYDLSRPRRLAARAARLSMSGGSSKV